MLGILIGITTFCILYSIFATMVIINCLDENRKLREINHTKGVKDAKIKTNM